MPSDEPYLPVVDIVNLFEELLKLKDPDITESIKTVVARLSSTDIESSGDHVKRAKEALGELDRSF